MLEILLVGLAVVVIYLVSHFLVTKAELMAGVQLGYWRTVMFFVVFLGLLLATLELMPRLFPGMAG
jgi:Na+-transporting NADH:ubiquinone oxidoreductase subunit NqrE